ncbi:MAG: hypothetical protein NUV73_00915 [Candidatus Daviesbacteria bacterium]|nr:hypothetical protein [Candidatus Daviesbacteria bacterium]
MSAEQDFLKRYQEGTKAFMTWGTNRGVANYSLEESPQDVPTRLWGIFAIYPRLPLGSRAAFLAYTNDDGKELDLKRALQLTIPERVKKIGVRGNPAFIRGMELVLAQAYMPSKVLAFGERVASGEGVAMLFCLSGVKPIDALKEIQQRIRESIARNN